MPKLMCVHGFERASCLVGLVEALGLGTESGSSRSAASSEVLGEHGGHEGVEDDLSAAEHGQGEPQEEHKLEDEVEGEPVDNVDEALDDSEEGEHDPVGQPLGVIIGVVREERIDGIVAGDDETGEVGEKLSAKVEDDEEEVQGAEADGTVRLGNVGGLFNVVQDGVLGKLAVELTKVVLDTVLGRHFVD